MLTLLNPYRFLVSRILTVCCVFVGVLFCILATTHGVSAQTHLSTTYDQIVYEVVSDPNVVDVATSSGLVSLKYPTHAMILGVLRLDSMVKVSVNSDGEVEVKYPWYGMFLTTDMAVLQAKIQAAVRGTLSPADAASEKTIIKDRQFSRDEQVAVLEALHRVLKSSFSVKSSL